MTSDAALEITVRATAELARNAARDTPHTADHLVAYATALEEIADGMASLDQRELELKHQLGWWSTRIDELERERAGGQEANPLVDREIALFRGRISGANAMLRHYQQERNALEAVLDAASAKYGVLLDE